MNTPTRDDFITAVHAARPDQAVLRARELRDGRLEAAVDLAALAMRAAAVAPEELVQIYDGIHLGWTGDPIVGPAVDGGTSLAGDVPSAFWDAIFAIVEDPEAGRDPSLITTQTASAAGLLPPALHARVAATARRYPDVERAAASGMPRRFTLEELATCPADSLGGALYSLVVDKGFDLEVLDRDSLGLKQLPAPLDYLNVRILQCHDAWHEVAGYETTGLHEVAISGFQMAQFGHHYSSVFLAVVLTKTSFDQPDAAGFLLDTILAAYRHGRVTPPLIGVDWPAIWAEPMDEIRRQLGVVPFASPYPPGILEDLRPR
jgi:ubiquinone biosynthesis protein Coq4